MINFFKKPELTFWPVIEGLDLIEPVVIASHARPEWITTKNPEEFSIKLCPGIRDFVDTGFIINMWQDLIIDPQNTGPIHQLEDINGHPFGNMQMHPASEFAGIKFCENQLPFSLKIKIPWLMSANKDIDVLMLNPPYNNEFKWQIVPGMLKPYKYHNLLLQLTISNTAQVPFTIKKGTPIAHIVPLAKSTSFKMQQIDEKFKKRNRIINNWVFSKSHSMTQYTKLSELKLDR